MILNQITRSVSLNPPPAWPIELDETNFVLYDGQYPIGTYLQMVGLSTGVVIPISGVYSPVARRGFMQAIGKISKWLYENERKAVQLTLRLEEDEEEVTLDGA